LLCQKVRSQDKVLVKVVGFNQIPINKHHNQLVGAFPNKETIHHHQQGKVTTAKRLDTLMPLVGQTIK
jgi:hypothetical protein